MKKNRLFLCAVFLLALITVSAQVRDPQKTVERQVENRANTRVDRSIDRGLDKVEEGIGNIFKKKQKKKADDANTDNNTQSTNETSSGNSDKKAAGNTSKNNKSSNTFASYGKFDFVPGEKILVHEDFSQDAVGDFPAKWNTNGSGEVVTLNGQSGKWLQLSKKTRVIPDFITSLPENFTLEFDLVCNPKFSYYSTSFDVLLVSLKKRQDNQEQFYYNPFSERSGARIRLSPTIAGGGSGTVSIQCYADGKEFITNDLKTQQFVADQNQTKVHVAIWRQKQRLRVYVNEDKVVDVPRALGNSINYNAVMFDVGNFYTAEDRYIFSNLRLAAGAPDTRNKLITEGKFVTSGILFDVNAARIRPESYGILKEIGTVLQENPAVKVKIVGHTDADGDDASNMALSKKRAEAIREALTKEFSITADRMQSDGKGESQPVSSNNTPEGKANNRRVEFIKL